MKKVMLVVLGAFVLMTSVACDRDWNDHNWDNDDRNSRTPKIYYFTVGDDNVSIGESFTMSADVDYARSFEIVFKETNSAAQDVLFFKYDPQGRRFQQALNVLYAANGGSITGGLPGQTAYSAVVADNTTYDFSVKACGWDTYNPLNCSTSAPQKIHFYRPATTPAP